MSILCSFYDHVIYSASEFNARVSDFFGNGVLQPLTDFSLTFPATQDLTFSIGPGTVWTDGYRIHYNADPVVVLSVDPGNSTLNRIDLVEIGPDGIIGGKGLGKIQVVKGTPASSPTPPSPHIGFIPLYTVFVGARVTSIGAQNITDLRLAVPLRNSYCVNNDLGVFSGGANFIIEGKDGNGYGGKITPAQGGGLSINISPFETMLGRKYHCNPGVSAFSLTPRKATLIYAEKNNNPTIVADVKKYEATYPPKDGSTVLRYTFSETNNPQDTSGNNNHIAILDGCNRVDGWADYARQGNGSSGYMVTANYSSFPTGNSPFSEQIVYTTPSSLSGLKQILYRGGYTIYTEGTRLKMLTGIDTGFDLEASKTYFLGTCYDGTKLTVLVAGMTGSILRGITFSVTTSLNITGAVMYFLRNATSSYNYSDGTLHFYELKRTALPVTQLSMNANSLLFFNKYLSNPLGIMPNNSIALGFVWTNSTVPIQIIDNNICMIRAEGNCNEPPGTLKDFCGSYDPFGYFSPFGQEFSRAAYPNLFAIIGTQYGAGDGSTTARLPDLRGRTIIGLDNMGGLSKNQVTNINADVLGGSDGEETHTLTIAEMPQHRHTTGESIYVGAGDYAHFVYVANTGTYTGYEGGGQPHKNMQPWIALNKMLKY